MKKLCTLLCTEFFSQQNDTKIINFDEGVLILWSFFWGNVIFKICHFCLKSHNWRTANFHCLAPPGKVSALALKNEDSMNKRSIHYVTLQRYNPGEATRRNSSRPQSWLLIEKKQILKNDIASKMALE